MSRFVVSLATLLALLSACGDEGPARMIGSSGGTSGAAATDGGPHLAMDAGLEAGTGTTTTGPNGPVGPEPVFDAGSPSTGEGCDQGLRLTLRDFTEEHPDFEGPTGSQKGLVEATLGDDLKPVYAHSGSTPVTAGPTEFDQWYRDTPGTNMTFEVEIAFEEDPQQPGRYVYDNSSFFPLDDMGFGNGPAGLVDDLLGGLLGSSGEPERNYLFTTEAHTRFTYQGGEQFTFRGDDDLWIFINRKLAIDLGGVHGAETETVDLDAEATALGITPGETYPMDIFHAERHTVESNFRIETTIDLSCIENVDVPVL